MGYQRIYNGTLSPKDNGLFLALSQILDVNYSLQQGRSKVQLELPLIITDSEDFPDGTLYDSRFEIDMLGCYELELSRIVLYENRILEAAKGLKCDVDALQAVVFSHEMGHYIFFAHPLCEGLEPFPIKQHDNANSELYEIYAQLFAYWASQEIDWAHSTFDKLLQKQPRKYRLFENYTEDKGFRPEDLINLIAEFRNGKFTQRDEMENALKKAK